MNASSGYQMRVENGGYWEWRLMNLGDGWVWKLYWVQLRRNA